MPPTGEAVRRGNNNMSRFDSLDAQKEALRSGFWDQQQKLGDPFLVGSIGHFRERMETLWHAGEGEKTVTAMIIQRLLTQRIARQYESPTCAVPHCKGIVAEQMFGTGFVPALDGGKKDARITERACLRRWNP